jgi:hypothetical protein
MGEHIRSLFKEIILYSFGSSFHYHTCAYLKRERAQGKIMLGFELIIMGLILTLIGIFVGVAGIIIGANSDLLAGVGIFLVAGIPSLILGIFIINKPEKANQRRVGLANSQPGTYSILDFVGLEDYRSLRRAWILTTIGVLFVIWCIAWLGWASYSFFDPPQDFQPKDMLLIATIAGDPGLLIGGLLLLIDIRRIKSVSGSDSANIINKKAIENNRRLGWILAGVGGLCSLWGVAFIVLAIINSFVLPQTDHNISDAQQSMQCVIPGLLIGLPFLFSGIWLIISTGAIK